jgi:hypothetical protein
MIVSQEKTICRETSRVDPSLQVSVLFDPGTARPVAFTEGGECLTEPSMGEYHDSVDGARCRSLQDPWVFIDGYAWPSEGSTETSLKQLSSDRIDAVRKHLKNSAFPSEIADTTAHGSSRTTAPYRKDSPLPGVTLRLSKSAHLKGSPRGVTFRQITGTSVREEQLKNLRDFAANHRERLVSGEDDFCRIGGPMETVKLRARGGEILDLPTDCAVKSPPIVNAVGAWAQDLSDNDCDVSKTDPLSSYLDKSP